MLRAHSVRCGRVAVQQSRREIVGRQSELSIPKNWDVSPEWMTKALAQHHAGAVVSSVKHVGGSDGTSSRAVLELTYSKGEGPGTVFAKTKGDPLRRMFQLMTQNAFIEGRLALSGADLPLEHPTIYAGAVDRLRLNDMMVMEDVLQRRAVLNDATTPLSVDEVADGLRGLARLHSRYWGFDSVSDPSLSWIGPSQANPMFRLLVKLGCTRGLPRLKDHVPDAVAELGPKRLIENWQRQIATFENQPSTFLHGDAHVGNTYTLPSGELGFYDWGVVRKGHWSFDVGYFIISSLDVEARRTHAKDLVEIYRSALEIPFEEVPTKEQAWDWFRSSTPYGLAIWITTGAQDQYQDPEICANLSHRFGQAFLELDTEGALQQLLN